MKESSPRPRERLRLLWALREREEAPFEHPPIEERFVYLSWVDGCQVTVGGEPALLDLDDVLQRRFVERALIMLSPMAINEA